MSSLLESMESDAQEIPSDITLTQVAELAELLDVQDKAVAAAELALEAAKAAFNETANKKLPEAMSAIGLKKFELTDGTVITVKPYYYAKIDDDNREACHSWLEGHGFGDIIKHQFNVSLPKGSEEEAKKVEAALLEIGVSYTDKEAVHWQTLVAWLREQIESGNEVDLDLFRAQIGQVAKIKRPK